MAIEELHCKHAGGGIKKVLSNADEHFSLPGFVSANGVPVILCVIFAEIVQNPKIETGVDIAKSTIGSVSDPRLFENNGGENKLFPGGPTYSFRCKEMPCFQDGV